MIRTNASAQSVEKPVQRARKRTKLAILVNTVAPYRIPSYAALAETFETLVLHGGREANRSWALDLPPSLKAKEVWTVQIPVRKQTGVTGVWDTQYIHLNGGLVWWLPLFRPDVILSNELGLRTVLAVAYGWLARIPVWVQWEGTLHSERHVHGSKRALRKLLLKVIRHWVSYGASSSEYLLSLGVPPPQLLEVQNSVPHALFLKAPEHPVSWLQDAPKPVILSVGQMIRRKGFHALLDACGRMADRGIPFTLVLVGEGPERERLVQQARVAGIVNFHVLPNQSQEVLNTLYRAADVFIFPSMEDVWGLVVSEALWAGTPVLCSKYAGCADIVPEENIFDPVSELSFDDALTRAIEGRVRPGFVGKLMTCEQVSEAMRHSFMQGSPATSASFSPQNSAATSA